MTQRADFTKTLRLALRRTGKKLKAAGKRAGRFFGGVFSSVRRGPIGSFFKGLWRNIRRGHWPSIAVSALALAVVIGLPAILFGRTGSGSASAAVTDADENTNVIDLFSEELMTTPSPTPVPTPTPLMFEFGLKSTAVSDIQERLMELLYMDYDEPTEYFGPLTEDAIKVFQRTNGLSVTGVIDQATYDLLFSGEAKTYTVSLGVSGEDIRYIQSRLNELDYLDKVTGNFGEETEAAVKAFQKNNGLSPDGVVGEQTIELLYSEDAKPEAISYGEKSDEVLKYQKRLYKLGYLTSEPDGSFGRDTVTAVKLFQEVHGLTADGYLGPQTKELLMGSEAQYCVIGLGMSGDSVTKIQKLLKGLNYLKKVTGYYGSDTEDAVAAFQKRNSLSVDGKVGKKTMNLLASGDGRKASSDTPASTPKPSSSDSSSASSSTPEPEKESVSYGSGLDAFIAAAESKLGSRYKRGGKGPSTFDCSGFVYWCLRQAGVSQSYMTSSGWKSSTKYQKIGSISELRRGDVIVFRGHVAICIGSGMMIDASSSNGKVVRRSCTGSWCQRYFIKGCRVFG